MRLHAFERTLLTLEIATFADSLSMFFLKKLVHSLHLHASSLDHSSPTGSE